MSQYKHFKVLALPAELEPDSIYFVKSGSGFNTVITDNAGTAIPMSFAEAISHSDANRSDLEGFIDAVEEDVLVHEQRITDLENEPLPKEHEIDGERLTADITGTFNFDWNVASQFILTPTGTVTLGNSNLPAAPKTKVISGIFKASAFAVTFPANWKAKANNDALSDTLDTHFTAETFPDYILYTLENIPA